MFGRVRGSSGGLPGAEGGVHESSESKGRDGMGEGTKPVWVTRFTQGSWELPVAQEDIGQGLDRGGGLPWLNISVGGGAAGHSHARRLLLRLELHGSSSSPEGSGAQVAGGGSSRTAPQ